MTIKQNPYGVGYSGETVGQFPATCMCCHFEFAWTGPAARRDEPHTCPPCEAHTRGPQPERDREHAKRAVDLLRRARDMARSAKAAEKWALDKAREAGRQTAAALQSRSRARFILDWVRDRHVTDGRSCACGVRGCTVAGDFSEAYGAAGHSDLRD
ncbi:hypothetical protein [Gephyromycinifex aptenodytis]|uniref:hypothetical protein n=1 Tax=Gephyromycinifex aptenodytis TaxID=2716227 RepID=UPI001444DCEB|nr:hypothetical protein [Gephyromycinifex aptenodytis]